MKRVSYRFLSRFFLSALVLTVLGNAAFAGKKNGKDQEQKQMAAALSIVQTLSLVHITQPAQALPLQPQQQQQQQQQQQIAQAQQHVPPQHHESHGRGATPDHRTASRHFSTASASCSTEAASSACSSSTHSRFSPGLLPFRHPSTHMTRSDRDVQEDDGVKLPSRQKKKIRMKQKLIDRDREVLEAKRSQKERAQERSQSRKDKNAFVDQEDDVDHYPYTGAEEEEGEEEEGEEEEEEEEMLPIYVQLSDLFFRLTGVAIVADMFAMTPAVEVPAIIQAIEDFLQTHGPDFEHPTLTAFFENHEGLWTLADVITLQNILQGIQELEDVPTQVVAQAAQTQTQGNATQTQTVVTLPLPTVTPAATATVTFGSSSPHFSAK